jgi:conjugal transfer pilus assembly protein TraB
MIDFSSLRNRQWYLSGGILAELLGVCLIFWLASSTRDTSQTPQKTLKSSLVTGASRTNPQEAWIYQFGAEAEIAKKRLNALEEMLTKLLKMNEAKNREAPNSRTAIPSIEEVRQDLKSQQNSDGLPPKVGQTVSGSGQVLPPPPSPTNVGQSVASSPMETGSPGTNALGTDASGTLTPINLPASFRSKAVRKISLSLKNARNSKALKSVDNTIPAGAFARAVLLGGVDASASIQASSDPRPALLRLTDAGTLPRRFRSDLKGCHALAACYGDISSERVFMRLEKLTCTERKTGEIVEVKVQGYVAGEDGRTGVRGSVVDRAGESMRNVLMGGFLGGIGDFLSQSHNPVTFSPMAGLAQTNPMGMGDMLKAGAGKGINNALEKYADFYIKRAEQLQPVIQVAAGRQVDIVFTEGVSIGESVYRQAIGRSNDQGRYQQIQSVQEAGTPVTEWTGAPGTGSSGNQSQATNN